MAWLGSRITGRCVSSFSTGTAAISQVLRVAVSKVRMPRSQRITFGLPCATMYSADISSSLMVELMPRFSSTGRPQRAERFQQREVLHVARADLHAVGVFGDQVDVAIAHHFGDDGETGGFPAPCAEASGLPLPCPGSRRATCAA